MYYIMMISYENGMTQCVPGLSSDLAEIVHSAEYLADRNHDCQFTVVNEEGDIIAEFYGGV